MNIFKKDGKFVTPSTIEELEAMFPDMVTAIRAQGAAGVNTDEIRAEVVKPERERAMAIVGLYLKEDALKVVSSLLESALTAEHIKTIGATLVSQVQKKDETAAAEKAEKAKILAAIEAAGADNPGSDASKQAISQDYLVLVEQYQAEKNCSRSEAIRAITLSKPDAHKAYIKKINEKVK